MVSRLNTQRTVLGKRKCRSMNHKWFRDKCDLQKNEI
jgi:hypothetical protein